MKMTKWLLVLTSFVAAWSVALAAQGPGVSLDLRAWTPATVLAVSSVIFSFGISYQTIRVHGKVLKDFEAWRKEHVDPTLNGHAVEIARLQVATGTAPAARGKNNGRR